MVAGGASIAETIVAHWISPSSGLWTDPASWSTNPVFPNNGTPPDSTYHVVLDTGSLTVEVDADILLDRLSLVGLNELNKPALRINAGQTVRVAAFALNIGSVHGAGNLLVESRFDWIRGALGTGAQVVIGKDATLFMQDGFYSSGGPLDCRGLAFWTSGQWNVTGAAISNSGTFTGSTSSMIWMRGDGGIGGSFDNSGDFVKSGSGVLRIGGTAPVRFHNHGAVEVEEGSLLLEDGGSHTGTFAIAPGGTLKFGKDNHFGPEGALSGGGVLQLIGGAFQVDCPVHFEGTFELADAELTLTAPASFLGGGSLVEFALAGHGDVFLGGGIAWQSGSMTGPGRLVVDAEQSFVMSSSVAKQLRRETEINGETTWLGGELFLESTTIVNNGVFNASAISPATVHETGEGVSRFINNGAFYKTSAPDTTFTTFSGELTFENWGLLEVQRGALRLAGASSTSNQGEFDVAPGATLSVVGALEFDSAASLEIRIDGRTPNFDHGRLTVFGDIAFAGALRIELENGFVPHWGDQWAVSTFFTRSGDFEDFDSAALADPSLRWWRTFTPTSCIVGVSHIADVNRDNQIGFADLNTIISGFNAPGTWEQGDADGDGFVGFADLNLVISNFNTAAPD